MYRNDVMDASWEDIFSPNYKYATRISGALLPLMWNNDYSNGAYFWNKSSPQTGFNWYKYTSGALLLGMHLLLLLIRMSIAM